MKWYRFTPADTLFFRGGEPMEAGEDHDTTTVFPPPVSVIQGALRTAVLRQKGVSIQNYKNAGDQEIIPEIGRFGKPAPFCVLGPLFEINGTLLVPVPATWYANKTMNSGNGPIKIVHAGPCDETRFARLGMKSSAQRFLWCRSTDELKPLAGFWVDQKALSGTQTSLVPKKELFALQDLYVLENRVGIKIDQDRRIDEGHLYSARHIRLKEGVSIVWGLDRDIGLAPETLLFLGGEQRFGLCRHDPNLAIGPVTGGQWLSLSPVQAKEEASGNLVASAKPLYLGGWDLAKGFHKPTVPWYPAGAVFSKQINNSCIAFS